MTADEPVEPATGEGRIVVAVDGSAGAEAALAWAVAEAELRASTLELVLVRPTPHRGAAPGMPFYGLDPSDFRSPALDVLSEIADRARLAGSVPVRPVLREGLVAEELIDASDGAVLLVVGSRGHGGFTGLLLGSVSQQCVLHARCPVAVVRDERSG